MTKSQIWILSLTMACAARGAEPLQVSKPNQAMESAVAAQKSSVSAMSAALEAQRAAIIRQTAGSRTAVSFFLLPPPARSGDILVASPPRECGALPASQMQAIVEDAALREDLQPELLRGVIRQESAFYPCAVSRRGAMGLMQLMPATAAQLGVQDPFDPKQNVDAGARLLRQLLSTFGNLPLALGAYNAGPASVNQAGGVPDFPETRSYIQSILTDLYPASKP